MNENEPKQPVVRAVDVQLRNGSIVSGKFLIWIPAPEDKSLVRIAVQFLGREVSQAAESCIFALNRVRAELEKDGTLLRCYGNSRNTISDGMSGSMRAGSATHKCYLGKKGAMGDLVSIFGSGPDVDPCTLQEQAEFRDQWLTSLGIDPNRGRVRPF